MLTEVQIPEDVEMLMGSGSSSWSACDLRWGAAESSNSEEEAPSGNTSLSVAVFAEWANREVELLFADFDSTIDLHMLLWKPLHFNQFKRLIQAVKRQYAAKYSGSGVNEAEFKFKLSNF